MAFFLASLLWLPFSAGATSILLTLIGLLLAYFLYYFIGPGAAKKLQHLADAGVPCMPPLKSELQNMAQQFSGRESASALDQRQILEYGPMYAKVDNGRPALVFGDVSVLRDIFIKNFDCFTNRQELPEGVASRLIQHSLFFLRDLRWKKIRTLTTPSFSARHMRNMDELAQVSLQLCENDVNIKLKDGQELLEVEAKSFFNTFVMDLMGMAFFGVEVDNKNSKQVGRQENHPFVINASEALKPPAIWRILVLLMMPFESWKIFLLRHNFTDPAWIKTQRYFDGMLPQMIRERRRVLEQQQENRPSSKEKKDFLTTLITARAAATDLAADAGGSGEDLTATGDLNDQSVDSSGAQQQNGTKNVDTKEIGLTDGEIAAQCFIFLFAGFESTSTTISFFMHAMAMHQEIQERAAQEVSRVLGAADSSLLNYETLSQMPYLDAVVNETLRLYTPVGRLLRECNRDCQLSNGVRVRRGQLIIIPAWYFHHSPEFFADAQRFDPDRFYDSERRQQIDPYIFMPFGHGPRNCVGMRFALLSVKFLAAFLLLTYKIERPAGKEMENPVKMQSTFGSLNRATNGIHVALRRRQRA